MFEIEITEKNFNEEVLKSELPVLLDFWAEWCGPCRMLAPAVAEIAKKYQGKVKVGKVNVDEAQGLASLFGIESIPTLVLMKDGKPEKSAVGLQPIANIEAMLQ